MQILGIDVGGTGVKGAPVDVASGELTAPRYRLRTPKPATPEAVAATVGRVAQHFGWRGPIGCGFPAVIQHGRVLTAANISEEWIGLDGRALLEEATGCPVRLANDADVAGLAELRFGAGRDVSGTVLFCSLGTGIGSALFVDGTLVPNTELGHLEIRGKEAEERASEAVREKKDLSWKKWARRLDEVLCRLHALLWPELIVLGGGVSRKHAQFVPRLTVAAKVVPAKLRNEAGIVGAALLAAEAPSERARPPGPPPDAEPRVRARSRGSAPAASGSIPSARGTPRSP